MGLATVHPDTLPNTNHFILNCNIGTTLLDSGTDNNLADNKPVHRLLDYLLDFLWLAVFFDSVQKTSLQKFSKFISSCKLKLR